MDNWKTIGSRIKIHKHSNISRSIIESSTGIYFLGTKYKTLEEAKKFAEETQIKDNQNEI